MLGRLKQSSTFALIIIKVNNDLFEKENNRMYYKIVFIHAMYKIATKVLTVGSSPYLRSVKRTSILKKEKHFRNTNRKHPLGLNEKGGHFFLIAQGK